MGKIYRDFKKLLFTKAYDGIHINCFIILLNVNKHIKNNSNLENTLNKSKKSINMNTASQAAH